MTDNEIIDIEWKKCNNCGFLQHNTHLRCLKCKHNEFERVYPSGLGTLVSYTVLNAPPKEFRDKDSYALGIVEFSNGIKAMGRITQKDNLKIGIKLKAVYKEICEDLDGKKIKTFIFKPV
jgi:hypothetical protein